MKKHRDDVEDEQARATAREMEITRNNAPCYKFVSMKDHRAFRYLYCSSCHWREENHGPN